jgi:hypothetical protein
MARLGDNIIKFSTESGVETSLFDKFRDYVNHYRAIQFKTKVDYDNKISFEEKNDKMNDDITKAIAKLSGVKTENFSQAIVMSNPMYKWATDAIVNSLIDSILADSVITDFGAFAEIKYGGYGDTFTFDIDNSDLFVVSKMSNGKRHAFGQRQYTNQESLIPTNRAITVSEDYYRILAGKRNLASYAMKVIMAFEEEMALDIYNAINDTYSSLGANFKEASFTDLGWVQLAERISAANGASNCIAFGTKSALSYVLPTNDYLKSSLGTEYTNIGYIRDFMGVDTMQLKQHVEWQTGDYDFKVDNTRIYFISTNVQKLVKVAIEGTTMSFNTMASDTANLTEIQTLQKRFAVGLISNAKYGIMDVA